MSDPQPRRRVQFTIGSLMRDIAIAGVMFAGFSHRESPVGATLAAFALFYFVLKAFYYLSTGPLERFLRNIGDESTRQGDALAITERRDEAKRLHVAGLKLLQDGRVEEAGRVAASLLELLPTSLEGGYILGVAYLGQGKAEEARSVLLDVLEDRRLNPEIRPNLWNNVAWAGFLIGDPDLKDEADYFSAECIKAQPDPPPYKGTRGAVLVWNGRYDEGLALLHRAFAENISDRNRAFNLASIALGEAGRGDLGAARRALDQARRNDPDCSLLPRAERAIAGRS